MERGSTHGDVLVVTAVGVTAGAVDTEGTGGNVAEGEDTAVSVVLADDGLAVLAGLAALSTGGASKGSGHQGEEGNDESHFEGGREVLNLLRYQLGCSKAGKDAIVATLNRLIVG